MKEYLKDAKEELKRVDHLIFVSLKYTRTVDVIRSIIDRLINACDFIVDQTLDYAKKDKKIDEIPKLPGPKCDIVKEVYSDDKELNQFIDFYLMLRKIMRLEYTRNIEYRRHVYMGINLDGEELRINIDIMQEYYDKIKNYFNYVNNLKED
ncbi:hypothetical protein KY330_01080 [Candidatus Woesearchaeota archaeon]|nr:hypothetical protein [Candidatus Woesearchaeota archaeon]